MQQRKYIYNCNKTEEKHFSTNCTRHYSYVKFNMTENSYYYDNDWKDLINLNGFEMNGNYILGWKTRVAIGQWNNIRGANFLFFLNVFVLFFNAV